MLTLTLRSYTDGSYLARIVEQDGEVFVLDHGDPQMIADAVQRIQRGFTVMRAGTVHRVSPRQEGMLVALADHYAGEQILVAFEEPLWPGRSEEESVSSLSEVDPLAFLPSLEDDTQDAPTDVWSRKDADRVRELIGEARERAVRETWSPNTEDDEHTQIFVTRRAPTRDATDERFNVPEWGGRSPGPQATPTPALRRMSDDDGVTELFSIQDMGADEDGEDH